MIGFISIKFPHMDIFRKEHPEWTKEIWTEYFYHHQKDIPLNRYHHDGVHDPLMSENDYNTMMTLLRHLDETKQKLEAYQSDDVATVFGYNGLRFVLPTELVTIEPLKDYTFVTQAEMAILSGTEESAMMPLVYGETVASLTEKQDTAQKSLHAISEHVKAIESGDAEELADLKAKLDAIKLEMEARQKDLIAELDRKKAEMEEKLREIKKQAYILETEIYGLRCYLGETVNFYTVRDGNPAPEHEPVVIYQKIRYLDEELGRYASLYHFGDYEDDKETLYKVLQSRKDIADLLAPGPKSISVVKISRTGTVTGADPRIANMLAEYEMYHANQLAVLIRNGEQLHISWLDADKIQISDDNIFYTPGITEEPDASHEEEDWYRKKIREEHEKERRRLEKEEMISRWFFFAVLQGVLDNTNLIEIPDHASITKQNSPYIVFSAADGWIESNLYGSFADMLKRSADIPLRKGDMVLTGTHITRDDGYHGKDKRWNNNRGIGEKNRTSGVSLPRQAILPVNKVLPSIVVRYTAKVYKGRIICDPEGIKMWRTEHGGFTSIKTRETDVFDHYEASYSADFSQDRYDHEAVWEEVISPDRWHSYRDSYRQLDKSTLYRMSDTLEEYLYTDLAVKRWLNSQERLRDAYKNSEQPYFLRFTDAEVIGEKCHQYYCSVKQTGWGGGYNAWSNHETEYHVNFQFYREEVIPLQFLCSTWIRDVIQSGRVGDFHLCGTYMNFSDMLPYLQKILQHLLKREEKERSLILAAGGKDWIYQNPDWDVLVCDWRIEKGYHALTAPRAKQFLKTR